MVKEYGKWPEFSQVSKEIDWKGAKLIAAGVDVGTTSAQAAILCDGKLFGYANIHAGVDFEKTAKDVIALAMEGSGMAAKDIGIISATGFAKKNVKFASKTFDEIHCHAKGARFMFGPEVRTVVDMGGQTVKAIRLFEWDRVRDFMLNDKCATGSGRNIEVLCAQLHQDITEIGSKSLETEKDPEPVSTTCWAFAGTETLGLFGRPEYRSEKLSEAEIYASHLFAIAWRVIGIIGRLSPLDVGEISVDGGLAFTGGLAKNPGITARIERELGVAAAKSDIDPMLAGAIGAALLSV
ncbi:MAG: acyl-CoA dehydratase activase [Oscillospiraceae bacterium]|nr:acyl-CoA dehydratase activase [Oscillospiraceae bacterium]